MSEATFKAAIQYAVSRCDLITIGGGEPTLHPQFVDFVLHAIWEMEDITYALGLPAVSLVTNGSNTKIALKLAKLAERGVLSVAVSRDQYHDPIDPKVFDAFGLNNPRHERTENDYREIRTVYSIIPAGRAKSWGDRKRTCMCDAIFINPNGDVFTCGCRKIKRGNVNTEITLPDNWEEGYCDKYPPQK
jgi:MoaA/NifB/PqqE/SkfB family radical SAM enzyme